MSFHDALSSLASEYGIATTYRSSEGEYIDPSTDTILKTLDALGVDLGVNVDAGEIPTEQALWAALSRFHDTQFTRPLPPCVVATQGETLGVIVHVHDGAPANLRLVLEDGSEAAVHQTENWTPPRTIDGVTWGEATFILPADLPLGWHTLHLNSTNIDTSCDVVVTPGRLSTADRYVDAPVTGVMAQLYSVRSADSWGIGDFRDLANLAQVTAEHAGADYLLINPLHAGEPFPPIEDSPYLPTSRRFINPIYIRVEDVAEYEQLSAEDRATIEAAAAPLKATNHSADIIERNPIYRAKLDALWLIHQNTTRNTTREAHYQDYLAMEGQGLEDFARWCTNAEKATASSQHDQHYWEQRVDFYRWLQWICDQQFHTADVAARNAGMSIGIMADLAVGVHPAGSDAHNLGAFMAPKASVGAPADGYNQNGQDWSQPPWHPIKLAETGYRPWRDMLRTVLRHSGGIRVDHILGLFRLWWIPRTQSPLTGTYVYYDYDALVGILALEAERAGAVVIGEDLGTFEPWVQEVLSARGIMGTSIVWFEHSPSTGGPRHQGEYRQLALSSVTTHDLPPTAGFLYGEHIALREGLGLFQRDADEEDAEDLAWQNQVLGRINEYGAFHGTSLEGHIFDGARREQRGDIQDLLVGLHRYLAGTPSALTCMSLVDMVGDVKAQNQPGTTRDLYPNWCIPLCDAANTPVLIEDLPAHPLFSPVAQASKRSG